MADKKESEMSKASAAAYIRGLDANGDSVNISVEDVLRILSPSIVDLIKKEIKIGGRNLFLNSEIERTGGRFISIPTNGILSDYIGQEIVVSFDLKAAISRNIRIYPYQDSGISVDISEYFQASTEYQRFSFRTRVRDFGQQPALTAGEIALYDYSYDNILSIRRIKIELGNMPTDWTPAVEEMINS